MTSCSAASVSCISKNDGITTVTHNSSNGILTWNDCLCSAPWCKSKEQERISNFIFWLQKSKSEKLWNRLWHEANGKYVERVKGLEGQRAKVIQVCLKYQSHEAGHKNRLLESCSSIAMWWLFVSSTQNQWQLQTVTLVLIKAQWWWVAVQMVIL